MDYFLLLLGFFALVKGADLFVDGSSSVAKLLKVPSVIIGLTIVAMGTSAPEASVSIFASLVGNNDIAISNVVGSNIFNSLVVVGVCATLLPFITNPSILKRDLFVNIFASILLFVFILDLNLSRFEGLIFLTLMIVYLYLMIKEARKNKIEDDQVVMSPSKSIFYILIGLVVIIVGGNLVVTSASNIATHFGLSQNLIGLTIVAIGTSLPELVTSIVAVYKKDAGLALGNAIGSNIFNILFILGTSSTLSTLSLTQESIFDAGFMILVAILMYIFGKSKNELSRSEGIICLILYIAYTAYLILR